MLGTRVSTVDPRAVADAVGAVRDRILRVAGARPIELIAVTKGFGADAIQAAIDAGCTSVGENYAQELRAKMTAMPAGTAMPQIHFIGHLQTNKVKVVAEYVSIWHTVDRAALADEIARRSPRATVFVQVNTTAEATKGGCIPAESAALVAHCRSVDLSVVGLMTIGPTTPDPALAHSAFALLARIADDLGLASRSMGMSDDLEIALEHGATHVRIGSALFGERPQRRAQMR